MTRFTIALLIGTASFAPFAAPAGAQPIAPDACKKSRPRRYGRAGTER